MIWLVVVVRRALIVDLHADGATVKHGPVTELAGSGLTVRRLVMEEAVAAMPVMLNVW